MLRALLSLTALTLLPVPLSVQQALSPQQAADASKASLLILSKKGEQLAIVDPISLKVLARIPAGSNPHEVIASADGRTAFISNYGYGAFHTITPVDLVTRHALPAIETGALRGPHGLAFAQGQLWFTAEIAKSIARYNPATHTIEEIVGLGQNRTHMLFVAPDLSLIVTSNVNSSTVSLLQQQPIPPPPGTPPSTAPHTEWGQTILPVGHRPEGFDVSPSHQEIWVGNGKDGTLSIINVPTRKVVATLPANLKDVVRLRFTPDGRLVLIASLHEDSLAIYDAATRREIKRIPIAPGGGGGILVQPDGARAFVSCSKDNYVAVIDLKTLTVTSHIETGPEPDGLAWATHP